MGEERKRRGGEAMIEIHELSKNYKNHGALKNLSLSVPDGSAFLVVGANGAGKTTMIKIIMNLLRATSGTAEILGVDSRRLSPREFAQIGYVSENQELPGKLSVAQYLAYLRPFYPTWDKLLEAETLRQFRLPGERRIHELSHGMRVKFALTCALSYRPRLLVLDEPFSGLDPLVRDEFMEGLAANSQDKTILMSSHELGETEAFGTDLAFIDDGRLVFQESMDLLTGRMQEIKVVLNGPACIPSPAPEDWIDLKQSGNVLTFVHTQFVERELHAQLQAIVKGVQRVEVSPMPLRTIFTSLSRVTREEREEGAKG
jgi:ABC-type multidrug transport system ATPase subunit